MQLVNKVVKVILKSLWTKELPVTGYINNKVGAGFSTVRPLLYTETQVPKALGQENQILTPEGMSVAMQSRLTTKVKRKIHFEIQNNA